MARRQCWFLLVVFTLLQVHSASADSDSWETLLEEAAAAASEYDFPRAVELTEQAVDTSVAAHGDVHAAVARCLHDLAKYQFRNSDLRAAETCRRAVVVWEALPTSEPLELAKTLSNLGVMLKGTGQMSEAAPVLERALSIRRELLPPEHPRIARSIGVLGDLYYDLVDIPMAIRYQEEALALARAADPPDERAIVDRLTSLALTYYQQSRTAEALRLWREAIPIYEANGELARFGMFGNMAAALNMEGHYAAAESLCRRGLTGIEESGYQDPGIRPFILKNLAIALIGLGNHDEALPVLHENLESSAVLFGKESDGYYRSVQNLAHYHRANSDFAVADSLYTEALRFYEDGWGREHHQAIAIIQNLGLVAALRGDPESWFRLASESFHLLEGAFRRQAPVLTENALLDYTRQTREALDRFLSSYLELNNPTEQQTREIARAILQGKGQVSDEVFVRRRESGRSLYGEAAALDDSLLGLRRELAATFAGGRGDADQGTFRAVLDSLSRLICGIENRLVLKSAFQEERLQTRAVVLVDVARAIPERTLLLEFHCFDKLIAAADTTYLEPHYAAMTVDSAGPISIADLGAAESIETLISEYRRHLLRVADLPHAPLTADLEEYSRLGSRLFSDLLGPFRAELSDRDWLIIAPDACVNLVSFATLLDPEGRYLTERFGVHYLTTGRDLLRHSESWEPGRGMLSVGAPDFDAPAEERRLALFGERSSPPDEPGFSLAQNTRFTAASLEDFADIRFAALPHTRREAEMAATMWSEANRDSAWTLLGAAASETNLRDRLPGKRALHLATHGYYLIPGDDQPTRTGFDLLADQGIWAGHNPLLLSGVVLAGVNAPGEAGTQSDLEDGVLSALEVASLDLRGLDLVVLSACESGLGDVRLGEGVYGLRRAFQLAGAQTVICALWPVPDDATADLMQKLYQRSDIGFPLQLRAMQLERLHALRDAGLPDHPYSWGGFISIGSPGAGL
ncbi:MAG: CHAT domain-containing tetratricopeptide repeat protein [bacterium]